MSSKGRWPGKRPAVRRAVLRGGAAREATAEPKQPNLNEDTTNQGRERSPRTANRTGPRNVLSKERALKSSFREALVSKKPCAGQPRAVQGVVEQSFAFLRFLARPKCAAPARSTTQGTGSRLRPEELGATFLLRSFLRRRPRGPVAQSRVAPEGAARKSKGAKTSGGATPWVRAPSPQPRGYGSRPLPLVVAEVEHEV